MIHAALHRPIPVELTDDRRVASRVRRLAATSVVALGLIWALAAMTLQAPAPVLAALAAGWILMPACLAASLRRPGLRYLLVLPSTLVGVALTAIAVAWRPPDPMASLGWILMAIGVLLGGAMGLWFWFRVMPVPRSLDDPFSTRRWAIIALHVGLVVAGLVLVLASRATAPAGS